VGREVCTSIGSKQVRRHFGIESVVTSCNPKLEEMEETKCSDEFRKAPDTVVGLSEEDSTDGAGGECDS
jgi:hypothetical protein